MNQKEKKEFATLYWLVEVYGQVSRRDLMRLLQLENMLNDEQADKLEYLMKEKFNEDKYTPTEKEILKCL